MSPLLNQTSDGGVGELNIPILADVTKQISRDYGVLIEEEGIALRGLFIIDGNGNPHTTCTYRDIQRILIHT